MLAHEEGDHAVATGLVREALTAATRISDVSLRARAIADARAAEGAIVVVQEPKRAVELLTTAIGFYQDTRLDAFLPAPYLYRARASLRLGKRDDAQLDLERGIVAVERRPLQLSGSVVASAVDDAAA